MENAGRCPRCNRFMVEEEWKTHKCNFEEIPLRGCEEIILDHLTDSGEDCNGDHVHLAWALNGMLYRLIVCKHNPPHNLGKRWLGDKRDLVLVIALSFLVLHSFALVHAMSPTETLQLPSFHVSTVNLTLPGVR